MIASRSNCTLPEAVLPKILAERAALTLFSGQAGAGLRCSPWSIVKPLSPSRTSHGAWTTGAYPWMAVGIAALLHSERRLYLSIWEKSLWQVYLIFLLETIQLLEYLDLFEWKYYRNILSSGFLHGEEISFCSQNFVRGSQPLFQCWKTVGTHPVIKWKSSKDINPPQPMMECTLILPKAGTTCWALSPWEGQHHHQDLLWGLMKGKTGTKGKHKHEIYVKPISEGSKILVREYFSNSCAGRPQGL